MDFRLQRQFVHLNRCVLVFSFLVHILLRSIVDRPPHETEDELVYFGSKEVFWSWVIEIWMYVGTCCIFDIHMSTLILDYNRLFPPFFCRFFKERQGLVFTVVVSILSGQMYYHGQIFKYLLATTMFTWGVLLATLTNLPVRDILVTSLMYLMLPFTYSMVTFTDNPFLLAGLPAGMGYFLYSSEFGYCRDGIMCYVYTYGLDFMNNCVDPSFANALDIYYRSNILYPGHVDYDNTYNLLEGLMPLIKVRCNVNASDVAIRTLENAVVVPCAPILETGRFLAVIPGYTGQMKISQESTATDSFLVCSTPFDLLARLERSNALSEKVRFLMESQNEQEDYEDTFEFLRNVCLARGFRFLQIPIRLRGNIVIVVVDFFPSAM